MKFIVENKQSDDSHLIPLINIVFLILIFFLIATVIRPFTAKDIRLSKSISQESLHKLAHTLVIDKTGALFVKGKSISKQDLSTAFLAPQNSTEHRTLTIIADQTLSADKLLEAVQDVQKYEFDQVKLVTERIGR